MYSKAAFLIESIQNIIYNKLQPFTSSLNYATNTSESSSASPVRTAEGDS